MVAISKPQQVVENLSFRLNRLVRIVHLAANSTESRLVIAVIDKKRRKSENRLWPLFQNPCGTILLLPRFRRSEGHRILRFKSGNCLNFQGFFVAMNSLART